jgi:hypothetical protein
VILDHIVLRRAEARRKLPGTQKLVELRRLCILLLRYQLIERRWLRPIRLQQQDHMFHRETRIHRHCTRCMRERRMNVATPRCHAALGDSFP